MNTFYVAIKDITSYNGFDLKETGNTQRARGCLSHYSFPSFPGFAYDK